MNSFRRPWRLAATRAAARAERLRRELRAEKILAARDYGFCLYPEKSLREFLLAFPGESV